MSLFKKKGAVQEPPEIQRYRSDIAEKDEYWKTKYNEVEPRKYPENFDTEMAEWRNSIEQIEKRRIRGGKKKVLYPED